MEDIDRMAVNSAILALIADPFDKEAAQVIIEAGIQIPLAGSVQVRIRHQQTNKSNVVAGQAAGHGSVSFDTGEETKVWEYVAGLPTLRAGHYKLRRPADGVITFQYYWKADETTQAVSEAPPVYYVVYAIEDLSYKDLELREEAVVFRFGWIRRVRVSYRSLQDPERVRKGGFAIYIGNEG